MTIQIDKEIPIPEIHKTRLIYPFHMMNIGDSFSVPADKAASMRNCIIHYQKKNKAKFLTRLNRNGTQVRVWRVA